MIHIMATYLARSATQLTNPKSWPPPLNSKIIITMCDTWDHIHHQMMMCAIQASLPLATSAILENVQMHITYSG